MIAEAVRDLGLPYWVVPVSGKFSKAGVALADRHYSRRTPGSPQFMPPGETLVLITRDGLAVYGWWRPHPDSGLKAMNGLDGWTCTIFHNESQVLASVLIAEAEQALVQVKGQCGPSGLITYVENRKVRSVNPGYCFAKAGYTKQGWSADRRKRLWTKPFALAGVLP